MASEHKQEAQEKTQPFSARPAWNDAFTALSMLDTAISASDADEENVKAMDDIKNFVTKIYMQCLKQSSSES